MKKDNILLLIVITSLLFTIAFNYKDGFSGRPQLNYTLENPPTQTNSNANCEKAEPCNCPKCRVYAPPEKFKIPNCNPVPCKDVEPVPIPIQAPCPTCPTSIENLQPETNTCTIDYRGLKEEDTPLRIRTLMASYQETISNLTSEKSEPEPKLYNSEKEQKEYAEKQKEKQKREQEKRTLFHFSTIINLKFILRFIKCVIDDKTDETINLLKGPMCLSSPLLSKEEIDYLNTLLPRIIKPLSNDKMFEQIINKMNNFLKASLDNACKNVNITCNL